MTESEIRVRSFTPGRSRNDQVALDMKLYVRDEIDAIDQEVKALLEALQKIMEENVHTYMPGFTHLQKAQPVTLAHHVGAYFEMFSPRPRPSGRYPQTDELPVPLGAGALAGTTYPLGSETYTARASGICTGQPETVMDSVSDRDYVIELLSCPVCYYPCTSAVSVRGNHYWNSK